MSNMGADGIAVSTEQVTRLDREEWPGFVRRDNKLLRWGGQQSRKIEVVIATHIDPTEESNALGWGDN